jgi:hypothetical protein
MKKFDYTTLTWSELLTKTKDWFNAPRAVTEALKRLKDLISANQPKYKVYTASLTQSSTDAPIAVVLENTLGGEVIWSYVDIGVYKATTPITLTDEKTAIIPPTVDSDFGFGTGVTNISFNNNEVYIYVSDVDGVEQNGGLYKSTIEIRVYN